MTKITFPLKNLMTCLVVFLTTTLVAQEGNSGVHVHTDTSPVCVLPPGEFAGLISIPRDPVTASRMDAGGSPCTTFVVNYSGFTPQAQAAFQYAVDIWANSIESTETIRVTANYISLGAGVLGSAGPDGWFLSSAPGAQTDVAYPSALWEKLEGEDTNGMFGSSNDIVANFSSDTNWYFGTDANPPAGQFDFVTVVLHELGHGLGFSGFANVTPNFPGDDTGEIRAAGLYPGVYDTFNENGAGVSILNFAEGSEALGTQLQGDDLFINSPTAIAQYGQGGAKPEIHAPSNFSGGSSIYHWNPTVFPIGNINSLMRPSISPGAANHNPGFITLGLFQDMGWGICPGALSIDDLTLSNVSVSPNPFAGEITITLKNSFNDNFNISLFDINGRLIKSETGDATNGAISLSNLSDLDDAIYFVKITNETTGSSITKKVIKN